MRTCPFNDCDVTIPEHIFACRRHWFALGKRQRAEISAAYDDYMEERIGIEALRERQQAVLGTRGTAHQF